MGLQSVKEAAEAAGRASARGADRPHRRVALALGRWLAAVAVGGLLAWLLPLDAWLAQRHDGLLAWFAPPPPHDGALVVDVDDASIARLGPWPLRRDAYLPAGQWLLEAGARALVFGSLFVDAREGDEAFGRWLAAVPAPVLLGARSLAGDGETRPAQAPPPGCRVPTWPAWQLPLWAREGAAEPRLPITRVGALSVPVDDDGVLRRLAPWQQAGALALPVLPLAVWQALHPEAAPAHCEAAADGSAWLVVGAGQRWPLDAAHRLQPWLARPTTAPVLSLARLDDAAAGRLPPGQAPALAALVRGRVLFIGSSAALGNAVATAAGPIGSTELLAASYDALAQGRLLAPPRPWHTAALLALGLLPVLAGLGRRASPAAALGGVAAGVLGLLAVDLVLLLQARQLLAIGWPLATLATLAVLALWQGQRAARVERARLQRARAEAEAASRVKSDFLAHVSHEIRTPLHALLGSADLLAASALDERQARHVQLFQGAGQELLMMLGDLLDLSKAEAGLLTLAPQPFSLPRLVAQSVLLFEARAAQKGLALQVESDPDLPDTVVGDASRLAQVLRNLLSNALKFTSVGGVMLVVRRGGDGRRIRFEVRDTGIGLSAEQAARLFQPYVQADDQVARQHGGTGLGLAISRRLVEAMGGRLDLHSREGLGAVFAFELLLPASSAVPAAVPAEAAGAVPGGVALPGLIAGAAAAAGRWAAHRGAAARPLRLLLADDSPHALRLAQAYLEGVAPAAGAPAVQVEAVQDGAAALRRFEAEGHDIVLMDLHMPVLDGAEAARRMRASERRRGRPPALLVALSGDAGTADAAAARSAGFDAHLGKPCTRAALLAVLGLQQPAPQAAAGPAAPASGAADAGPDSLASAPPLARISQLPDSDLDEALQRLGSTQLYGQVLAAAAGPLQHFDQRLAQALDTVPCDLDLAHRLAHDLCSIASTLGLSGLAGDARRLERRLAVTVTPTEDAELAAARRAVARRLQGVRTVLAPPAAGGARPGAAR